jgi:hypothetical protein
VDIEKEVRRWRRGRAEELLTLEMSEARAIAHLEEAEPRFRARCAWIEERMAAMKAAQKALDAAWFRQLDAHPDVDWDDPDAPELPDPPEQAAFDAIYAEIRAVIDHDRWPRHLHFPNV